MRCEPTDRKDFSNRLRATRGIATPQGRHDFSAWKRMLQLRQRGR